MIAIATDHGGLETKEAIKALLESEGHAVLDLGTMSDDSVDYPDYAEKLATALARGDAERGVLICGTGIGMSISVNKFPGIRGALVHDEFTARMSREHNDANVLIMGGRILSLDVARTLLKIWLETPFEGDRHQRRLDKITEIEKKVREGRL